MKRQRAQKRGRLLSELAGALFLMVWAAVGWISIATNAQLTAFDPGVLDPGPAWMAAVVLAILTIGAFALVVHAVVPIGADDQSTASEFEPPNHRRPAIFLASVMLYAMAMPVNGFLVSTALFAFVWILCLTPHLRARPFKSAAVAAVGSAIITGVIHLGFVVAIRAPLP